MILCVTLLILFSVMESKADIHRVKQNADQQRQREKDEFIKRRKKFAVVVILDPDTAHAKLILSDDGKQVTLGDTQQNILDSPLRFDYPSVLGKQSFSSGRFYYDVQVGNKTEWTLGVVKENIDRKNWRDRNPESGFWTITLRNVIGYRANADPPVRLKLIGKLEKVGVFVDYDEGLVCFYNVDFKSHIYSFTEQTFTEKLYPYFSPRFNEGDQNKEPMIITDVTE